MSIVPIASTASKKHTKSPIDFHKSMGLEYIDFTLKIHYLWLSTRSTFTAQATEQPTIGLLPMPRKPIIST